VTPTNELVATFRRHLYLPDPGPVLVVLGAVVANLLSGDPVWLLLVGPPSSGKTEILSSLTGLTFIHEVSVFTEAGLLSGSIARQEGATGGLLAQLGRFGIIVAKDFTSLLSESAEVRSGLLAALREIFDGRWSRRLGTGGGRTIGWCDKAGFLGAVTETIDRAAAVIGAMGERMVLYRMPELDDEGRLEQARVAQRNAGRQASIRAELRHAVSDFINDVALPDAADEPDEATGEALVLLSDLATRCRFAVERDSRDRQIELVPQPEAAARLQAELVQLLRGLWASGVDDQVAWDLIVKGALDGMPKARRAGVELLAGTGPGVLWTSAQVADAIGLSTPLTVRMLEDLAAHRVIERHSDGGSHRWGPSEWLRSRWADLQLPVRGDVQPSAVVERDW
jgi:hypothetical protein